MHTINYEYVTDVSCTLQSSSARTSIQLKLKVIVGVCNYVILANLLIFNNSVPVSQGTL